MRTTSKRPLRTPAIKGVVLLHQKTSVSASHDKLKQSAHSRKVCSKYKLDWYFSSGHLKSPDKAFTLLASALMCNATSSSEPLSAALWIPSCPSMRRAASNWRCEVRGQI
jgi:hypothetical protein